MTSFFYYVEISIIALIISVVLAFWFEAKSKLENENTVASNFILNICNKVACILLILCVVIGLISSLVSDDYEKTYADNQLVYIAEYGTKYHVDGCNTIINSNNITEVSINAAESEGYEPCKVCEPGK